MTREPSLDENTIRRLFADAGEPVGLQPTLAEIKRTSRNRRLRNVGLGGVAVIAAVAVAVPVGGSVLSTDSSSPEVAGNDKTAAAVELDCSGQKIQTMVYDSFMGKGYSTPKAAVSAIARVAQGRSTEVVSQRDHSATVVVRRPDGSVQAKFDVGSAAGGGSGWQASNASACRDFDLTLPSGRRNSPEP